MSKMRPPKLLALCAAFTFAIHSNAQPTISIGALTGDTMDLQWGLNGEDAFTVAPGNDPGVWAKVEEIAPNIIRFPGGTVANFYHPAGPGYALVLAQIQELSGDVATHMEDSYATEQQLVSSGGLTQNYLQDMVDLAQGTQVKVLYCANVLTGTTTEALTVLQTLTAAGVDVVGVELGNEAYLHDYESLYPTVNSYISAALPFNDAIKAQYPAMKVSLAAAPPAVLNNEDAAQAAEINAWNNGLAGVAWADAIALHAYPELEVPCTQTTVASNLACALPIAASFAGERMDSAMSYLASVVGKEVWMTEWNVRGPWSNYGNSLFQGLFCAEMFNTVSKHPALKLTTLHNFLTDAQSYNVLRKEDGPTYAPMSNFLVLQALAPMLRPGNLRQNITAAGATNATFAAFADPMNDLQYLLVVNRSGATLPLGGLDNPAVSGTAWVVGGTNATEGTATNPMFTGGNLALQTTDLPDVHSLVIPDYGVAVVQWDHDGPFGINEFDQARTVKVFPNPAGDEAMMELDLKASAKVVVRIVSALGRVIQTVDAGLIGTGQHEMLLPLQGIAPGHYTLRCSIGDVPVALPLVKL